MILLLENGIVEEITGRISYPSSFSSKKILRDLRSRIQSARKENGLHIVISHMEVKNAAISFEYYAKRIKKGFLCKKRFIPSSFTIVRLIDFSDSLDIFIQEKAKQIRRHFGKGYKIRLIGQTMKEGDNQILVCLLVYK